MLALDVYPQVPEVVAAQEEFIREIKLFLQFRLPEQREQIKNRFKEMKTV